VTFSTARPVGNFVTGEPWVLGPVSITQISPVPSYGSTLGNTSCAQDPGTWAATCTEMGGTACCDRSVNRCRYNTTRNGVQVNPSAALGLHAFDGRSCGYEHSLRATLPIELPGNQISSVVLTESNPNTPTCSVCAWCGDAWTDTRGGCNWSPIKRGVVLTVMDTVPFADELRPPYVGSSITKKRYRTNTLNTNFLSLTPAAGAPSFDNVYERVRRTWFVHNAAEGYTLASPSDNMSSYGSAVSRDFGVAALSLVRSDLTALQRRTLALHVAQIGVDAGHSLWDGVQWTGSGGHTGYGRPLAAVIAGHLLGDDQLLHILLDPSAVNRSAQIYRSYYDVATEPDVDGNGNPIVVSNPYYMGVPGFPRMFPHGVRPFWRNNPPVPVDLNAPYFHCCSVPAWVGEVLATRLLGLEADVHRPELFDLIDRVNMEGFADGSHTDAWANAMWQLYSSPPALRQLLCQNGSLNRCLVGCNGKVSPVVMSGEQGVDCGTGCPPPQNSCN